MGGRSSPAQWIGNAELTKTRGRLLTETDTGEPASPSEVERRASRASERMVPNDGPEEAPALNQGSVSCMDFERKFVS